MFGSAMVGKDLEGGGRDRFEDLRQSPADLEKPQKPSG
jgi:hypothetical protein